MIRYSLIFAVAASVAACTTAPIDLVPESERAYAKSQARTGNTGGAVTVDNMLDDVRHRGSGVLT